MSKFVAGLRTLTFPNDQGWDYGAPHGFLFHETAGFSVAGAFTTLSLKGLGVHAMIDRDGTVYATGDLERRYYHAYEAARLYFGVEHVNAPQEPFDQSLTVAQLEASAAVAAEIVEFASNHWNKDIPLVKKGCEYTIPGFMSHVDGKTGPIGSPCGWNRNGHTDGLTSTWTWAEYLAAVKTHLIPPEEPVTDADVAKIVEGVTKALLPLLTETRDYTLWSPRLVTELNNRGYALPKPIPGETWAAALAAVMADSIDATVGEEDAPPAG